LLPKWFNLYRAILLHFVIDFLANLTILIFFLRFKITNRTEGKGAAPGTDLFVKKYNF